MIEISADPLLALACAVLAAGDSAIRNLALTADIESMLIGLTAVGVKLDASPATHQRVAVHGAAGHLPLSDLRVRLTRPTLELMAVFGVEMLVQPDRIIIPAPQRYRGQRVDLAG